LSVDSTTPQGHQIDFVLTITADGGYIAQETFSLLVSLRLVSSLFSDDFVGIGNWIRQFPWDLTSASSNSPPNSVTDSPSGNYENNTNVSLIMASGLDLTDASYAELRFYNRHFIEYGYDYGCAEVSTNGGSNWLSIGNYTGSLASWTPVAIPLTSALGYSNVLIRFRFVSDNWITEDGWYIDDVFIGATISANRPPSAPTLYSPPNDTTLLTLTPDLVVNNATDPEGDVLTYGFRVYSDSFLTQLVASVDGVPEGVSTTSWTVTPSLTANTQYWWRAYAEDGESRSVCMMDPASFHIGNVVGVEENSAFQIPNFEFGLFQNSPNPFHNSTLIRYTLPVVRGQGSRISDKDKIPVRLVVYDITGRLVETLINQIQETGVYRVIWEGKDQSSGIYFYRLTAGEKKDVRKMLLLK
ncbi:T9SS type A sorting domain-containing protein, partial [candidate division TA06 bacterium]|nr:T9SS type A sorting domain-containing protein [candidate division TA06 bacterium]